VEVALVAVPDKFDVYQSDFRLLLAGMRTNEKGKIEAATPPGAS
jgi:hypothetical protein